MNNNILLLDELNKQGLNLHTLSERSGVAYSTVYNIFTGKKSISDAHADSLYRVARYLGLSMDELFYRVKYKEENESKIMPDFLLMWEDEVISSVHIEMNRVSIKRYSLNPFKQIFFCDEVSRYKFGEILRSRCWDEKRPDIKELLNSIGLNEYNPYKICIKTHGKMVQDKTWFKFEGETLNYSSLTRTKYAAEY